MENFKEKKYKTLYPDTIISQNRLLYKQTNKDLNTFLKNHFTSNYYNFSSSNIYKFPIRNSYFQNKKKPISRKNTSFLKERPNSSKNNVRSLIESIRHDNYVSYNYLNNTRGPLKSAKYRNKNIFNLNNYNSYNSNIYNSNNSNNNSITKNTNLLSNESNQKSSKITYFKSNLVLNKLKKLNKYKLRNKKGISENYKIRNLNSFSFSNYISSQGGNKSKNISTPQTPNSTRYKSKLKRNSLKIEYDTISLSNSVKRNSRNRSSFSLKLHNSKNDLKIDNTINFNNKKLNPSRFKLGKDQRDFHQKLLLENLKSEVMAFEQSNSFYVDDAQLFSNLISPTKFQRDKFKKRIKKAAKYNDYFFKKSPFQKGKFEILKNKMKKNKKGVKPPHHDLVSLKSKKLLRTIQILDKNTKYSKKLLKNLDIKLKTDNLKKIIGFVVPVKRRVRDIDTQFKDEVVNYQKKIGKFFIYNGSGIYSTHLSTILRGDKIVRQAIKMENI